MSVKKFFAWTGHSCLKALKNLGTSIQSRYINRKKFKDYNSMISLSTYGRSSISTEVTVLEYEITPCMCNQGRFFEKDAYTTESNDNEFNECIERRWKCKYY